MTKARQRGDRRLLNVAKALRESPAPDKFTMGDYGRKNGCNTPACALGHYASRPDLQRTFVLTDQLQGMTSHIYYRDDKLLWVMPKGDIPPDFDHRMAFKSELVCEHFDITKGEAQRLFSTNGCGYAQAPGDAAAYIERFVNDRRAGHVL